MLNLCEVVSLSAEDYITVIKHLAEMGLSGDVTYDALILYAAVKVDVDSVVTFNEKDFRRIYPDFSDKIISR